MLKSYTKELCIIAIVIPISLASQAVGLESPTSPVQTENKSAELENPTSIEVVDWQTYEDGEKGYKIQYPQEWKIKEPESSFDNLPEHLVPEKGFTINADGDPGTEVSIEVKNASRTLDPETLKVQSLPLEHYANKLIQDVTTPKSEPTIIKNEAITFSGEPAWRVDYIFNFMGIQGHYNTDIFVIKDSKLYEVQFHTPPLKVEETRPLGEKIIQTFQFTNNTAEQLE